MALIGVAGGSGSGKTTFASQLCEFLELENAAILLQDSYYKDHSKVFKGDGSVNFHHPEALDWDLLFQHLKALKSGQAIEVPIYNFTTHSRELKLRDKVKIITKIHPYKGKFTTIEQEMINEQDKVCAHIELLIGVFDLQKRRLIEPPADWVEIGKE